jgi:hypothetical protein
MHTSAGARENARNAAAVVISKNVIGSFSFADQRGDGGAPADADALVKADQVRRRVGVHALAGRLERAADVLRHRAFAIGAGDVHHRRQALLWIAELVQEPLDALQRKVNSLGMELLQALQDFVARHDGRWVYSAARLSSSS